MRTRIVRIHRESTRAIQLLQHMRDTTGIYELIVMGERVIFEVES